MNTRKKSSRESSFRRGKSNSPRVVIITGLSGSGKTVALRAVEDLQFFCVDNLPVSLIASLITRISGNTSGRDIAIGIDIREREFLDDIDNELAALRRAYRLEVLFLEAETDILVRRFKETRRPHPLGGKLDTAITTERESLASLRKNADRVIDTSSFTPHQLRKYITSLYLHGGGQKDMTLTLVSFGFKYGAPQNIDLLFDIRFLPNPNFVPGLKELNGRDTRVADYVFARPVSKKFMKRLVDFLNFVIPLYVSEGRSYLSIAVGCTGGKHRSPAVVEELSKIIYQDSIDLNIIHRELS